MKRASILLVDDHPVVRRGLRSLLESQPGWKVVAEARCGRDAVRRAGETKPDVVVLDVSMPGLNGLDAAPLILKSAPRTRVLILTMHSDEELIEKSLQVGAKGYVLKSDADEDLVTAVSALLQNKTFFTPAVSPILFDRLRSRFRRGRRIDPAIHLTSREREIIQLVAEGKSNKEVATGLNISVRTVENHRARIMAKLHFQSFSELVRYAVRHQIVEP